MLIKKQNAIIILILLLIITSCITRNKVKIQPTQKEGWSERVEPKKFKQEDVHKLKSDIPVWQWSFAAAGPKSTVSADRYGKLLINADENCELKAYVWYRHIIFANSFHGENDCIEVTYNRGDDVGAGITGKEKRIPDIEKYNALSVCVKGKDGDEEVVLQKLRDDSGNSVWCELDIAPFAPAGSITKDWQTIVIPFSKIPEFDRFNFSAFKALLFSFGPKGAGEKTVYLDNIVFIRIKNE